MPRTQRVAHYIQRLAYENLFQHEKRDERPEDADPRAPEPVPNYSGWNPTSFSAYVPFRAPDQN
jgi:hypothetical protein